MRETEPRLLRAGLHLVKIENLLHAEPPSGCFPLEMKSPVLSVPSPCKTSQRGNGWMLLVI